MTKVYQTRFGGYDKPLAERGNCFQACVATVLQIPLEEAFDCWSYPEEDWWDEFNKWLEKYGLNCFYLEMPLDYIPIPAAFPGIYIGEYMSTNLSHGERHVVVVKDGWELVHDPDPLPKAKGQGEIQGVYMFVPLKPYRLVNEFIRDV